MGFASLYPSFMDFIACSTPAPDCLDGFTINVGNLTSIAFAGGAPVFSSGVSYGDLTEPFVQANWTLVPVPATLPLMLLGAAAWRLGRRRTAA